MPSGSNLHTLHALSPAAITKMHTSFQARWEDAAGLERFFIITILVLTTVLFYGIWEAIYNVYFHPLSRFPGPLLGRATLIWRMIHSTAGNLHLAVEEQHKIYGPIVRVGPDELSFSSITSWKAIYGPKSSVDQTLVKSEFYDMYGSGFRSPCIGSVRDPIKHRQMKSQLSAAFSTKALIEQEGLVKQAVDKFVNKIGKDGGPGTRGINMTKWYEMVAFDVLGEMAFGQSFGCIDNGEPHFWQELILGHLFWITVADNLRRLPLVPSLARLIFPFTEGIRNKHTGYTRDMVESRLKSKTLRQDFLTNLVSKVENGEVPKEEMTAHSSTLIIAGGETVATFLAAVTYYLLKDSNPAYAKVIKEVRDRYNAYEQIDGITAQQIPYLQAVINEGLRIYPPGSIGFPRLSPGTVIDEKWIPRGVSRLELPLSKSSHTLIGRSD